MRAHPRTHARARLPPTPPSRVRVQRHTVDDLHSNEKGATCRARACEAVAARVEEACPFRPALNPNSLALAAMRRGSSGGSLLDRLDQDATAKVRMRQQRRQRQQKQAGSRRQRRQGWQQAGGLAGRQAAGGSSGRGGSRSSRQWA